jgi:hypothetical protein
VVWGHFFIKHHPVGIFMFWKMFYINTVQHGSH